MYLLIAIAMSLSGLQEDEPCRHPPLRLRFWLCDAERRVAALQSRNPTDLGRPCFATLAPPGDCTEGAGDFNSGPGKSTGVFTPGEALRRSAAPATPPL
jgi:hypothetical protein